MLLTPPFLTMMLMTDLFPNTRLALFWPMPRVPLSARRRVRPRGLQGSASLIRMLLGVLPALRRRLRWDHLRTCHRRCGLLTAVTAHPRRLLSTTMVRAHLFSCVPFYFFSTDPPPPSPPFSGARPTAGAVVGAWPGGFSARFSNENEPIPPSLSRPPVDSSATLLAFRPPPPYYADGRARLPTDVVPAAERNFVFAQTGGKCGDVWSQTDPLTEIGTAEAEGDFVKAVTLAVARGSGPAVNEGVDELSDDSESDPDAEKGDVAVTLSLDVMRSRARFPGEKEEEGGGGSDAQAWAPARDHLLQAAAAADVAAALKDAHWLTRAISGV